MIECNFEINTFTNNNQIDFKILLLEIWKNAKREVQWKCLTWKLAELTENESLMSVMLEKSEWTVQLENFECTDFGVRLAVGIVGPRRDAAAFS